ncbi:MAG: radical SAM protein [Sandaracinaceae bacterium]|nr:radical SAM protein [Sandaracinaceae bacterium]
MDVALILTHRCNFACGYCYAGEHHKTDVDEGVLARAVELLFADNAETVQLSFFGGEPFLAFDAMKRAVLLAEREAAARGRRLVLACTTNGSLLDEERVRFVREHGMRVTVSLDGVEEAHDLQRPRAGGGGSFAQAHGGLRRLLDAGVPCDAMMVITPETAEHAYLSVSFLWGEGVRTVRANVALERPWTGEQRAELREQLVSIGWGAARAQDARRGRRVRALRARAAALERRRELGAARARGRGDLRQPLPLRAHGGSGSGRGPGGPPAHRAPRRRPGLHPQRRARPGRALREGRRLRVRRLPRDGRPKDAGPRRALVRRGVRAGRRDHRGGPGRARGGASGPGAPPQGAASLPGRARGGRRRSGGGHALPRGLARPRGAGATLSAASGQAGRRDADRRRGGAHAGRDDGAASSPPPPEPEWLVDGDIGAYDE